MRTRRITRRASLAALAVAVALLAGCTPNWTQVLGGPGHAGSNPFETELSAASVGSLHRAWNAANYTDSAVVDGSSLFDAERDAGGGLVTARDLVSGVPRWRVSLPAAATRQIVADGGGGLLFVGSVLSDGAATSLTISALSQASGQQRWTHTFPSSDEALGLTFGDGRLFFSSQEGTRAFDAAGRLLWHAPYTANFGSYAAGRYYTGGAVLNAASGARLWNYQLEPPLFIPTLEVINGDRVLNSGENGLSNDPNNGVIAAYPAAGCGHPTCAATQVIETSSRQYGPPATQGDTVLAWSFYGVEAYSLKTGRLLWKETSDNDLLGFHVAGDLVWTYDDTSTFRAYRLAGCAQTVCPPVHSVSPSGSPSVSDFLIAQGHLVFWGLPGLQAFSVNR